MEYPLQDYIDQSPMNLSKLSLAVQIGRPTLEYWIKRGMVFVETDDLGLVEKMVVRKAERVVWEAAKQAAK